MIVTILPGILAGAGVFFCALSLWAARDFVRAQRRLTREHPAPPPVSILKPVKGLDPGLLDALRTHCTQDYPAPVELLIAVGTLKDQGVPVVRALQAEFPAVRIEIVETPLVLGTNGKVSNLVQLLPHARYGHLLISDADIAVGPRYLRRVAAPFLDKTVGLVTAGYRGRTNPPGRPTLGSRLEALAIATDLFPGVLCARLVDGGLRFGLGSTLFVTREALAAAGGLEALTEVLADDHDLGRNVATAGYKVVLSPEPVSTAVPPYTFAEFWRHQLRWARTIQAARPESYLALGFTHPLAWAIVYVLASGGSVSALLLLLIAFGARVAVALMVGVGLLRDRRVLRDLLLLPVQDCLAMALWLWTYADNTIEWRGERFRVRDGKLVRTAKSAR